MRYRPNRDFNAFNAMMERVDSVDKDTGVVVAQNFFPMDEELPPIENFDLTMMVKAGVPLQKVSTKVVGTGFMAVADALNQVDNENQPSNKET